MEFCLMDAYSSEGVKEEYRGIFNKEKIVHDGYRSHLIVDTNLEEILAVQDKIGEDIIIMENASYMYKKLRTLLIYDGYVE